LSARIHNEQFSHFIDELREVSLLVDDTYIWKVRRIYRTIFFDSDSIL